VYRARKPRFFELSGNSIAAMFRPKELDVQNQFEWRNVKMMCIYKIDGVYDEFGRFAPDNPFSQDGDIDDTIHKIWNGTMAIFIDDLHFKKPLLASTGTDTTRNLEPQFIQRNYILSYDQLRNDALTELEKHKFRAKNFDLRTSGKNIFDIRPGDTFFFADDNLVEDEDDTTNVGKKAIKLVAKKIEYSITSPASGVGGLSRRIIGSKRFV